MEDMFDWLFNKYDAIFLLICILCVVVHALNRFVDIYFLSRFQTKVDSSHACMKGEK
jgi:hypothetical protein